MLPSFSQLVIDNDTPLIAFANSLTLTLHDFTNYIHRDRDNLPVAYGWWFMGNVEKKGNSRVYSLDRMGDHSRVRGGPFLIPEYAVGIDFERYVI